MPKEQKKASSRASVGVRPKRRSLSIARRRLAEARFSHRRLQVVPRPSEFGTIPVDDPGFREEEPELVVHGPYRPGAWLMKLLRAKAHVEDIVATLEKRVLRGASDLHEVQRVLNDIGRQRGGGAAIKRHVNQEIITRLGRGGA